MARALTVIGEAREGEPLGYFGRLGLARPLSIGERSVVHYASTGVDGRSSRRPGILDPVDCKVELLDIRFPRLLSGGSVALVVEGEQRLLRIEADNGETTVLLELADTALDIDG